MGDVWGHVFVCLHLGNDDEGMLNLRKDCVFL